jgi:phage tail sheath protein FI
MLLVDAPSSWNTVAAAVNGIRTFPLSGSDSRNAALFFPRLRQPDARQDGLVDDFAPCGAVAGVFARTDTQRGVWKAPAGLDASLSGVPELSVSLTDPENVNSIRSASIACGLWAQRAESSGDRERYAALTS